MTQRDNLSSEQLELLFDHKRMKEQDKSPTLVSGQAVNAVREVLGASLRERGVSNPDSLSLEALAGQFIEMDEEEANETVTALSQMPVTGGQPAADPDPKGLDSLSADERAEVRDKLSRARKCESRLPQHTSELREQAETLAGVDDYEELEDDLETL